MIMIFFTAESLQPKLIKQAKRAVLKKKLSIFCMDWYSKEN